MIKELLLVSALIGGAPAITTMENEEEPIVEEPITYEDEDGKEYWIDFSKVDWSKITIDWENLSAEQFITIAKQIAEQAFSSDLLALVIAIFGIVGIAITFVITSGKAKIKANFTAKECAEQTEQKINELIAKNVNPSIDKLVEYSKTQTFNSEQIIKALTLAQQNTPEARKAIVDLLLETGKLSNEVANETVEKVEEQVKEEEIAKNEVLNKIDEMKDNGTSI